VFDLILVLALLSTPDLHCLADNIYHEARGEPYLGRLAVGHVTINRAKSKKFKGDTICAVVKRPNQFSWYKGRIHKHNNIPYQKALSLAKAILARQTKDPTNGATFFKTSRPHHNKYKKIGNHYFYWKF
tara:strand:- start:2710 stop:3096 length:387 start_codon:yes stop_codon:yes gene_type:complete